jgi:hypothetical protein
MVTNFARLIRLATDLGGAVDDVEEDLMRLQEVGALRPEDIDKGMLALRRALRIVEEWAASLPAAPGCTPVPAAGRVAGWPKLLTTRTLIAREDF